MSGEEITESDYGELRMRLMAHQVLLIALLSAHHDKAALTASVVRVMDQMQSQLLASRLDDAVLAAFDQEVQAILRRARLVDGAG